MEPRFLPHLLHACMHTYMHLPALISRLPAYRIKASSKNQVLATLDFSFYRMIDWLTWDRYKLGNPHDWPVLYSWRSSRPQADVLLVYLGSKRVYQKDSISLVPTVWSTSRSSLTCLLATYIGQRPPAGTAGTPSVHLSKILTPIYLGNQPTSFSSCL